MILSYLNCLRIVAEVWKLKQNYLMNTFEKCPDSLVLPGYDWESKPPQSLNCLSWIVKTMMNDSHLRPQLT